MQDEQIAAKLRIMPEKAARWRNRFLDGGLAALDKDAPRPGRTPTITPAKIQEVIRKTTQEKPSNATIPAEERRRTDYLRTAGRRAQAATKQAVHLRVGKRPSFAKSPSRVFELLISTSDFGLSRKMTRPGFAPNRALARSPAKGETGPCRSCRCRSSPPG